MAFAYTAALISLPFQPLHIFPIHFFYCLSLSTTPLHGFFESVFLVRRRERRVSGGLSFLRTGPANMVYSCPETVSDMYVNQGGRLQKGGRTREKGERGREWEREHEGRSLQKCQAASRQLKWGQGEERKGGNKKKKTLSGFVELFLLQVEKRFASIPGERNRFLLTFCLRKCTFIYHSKLYWRHMCTTKLDKCLFNSQNPF